MRTHRDYPRLLREAADHTLNHAAWSCAQAIAARLPPPSREANARVFERELRERFTAAVADLNRHWTPGTDASTEEDDR